MQGRGMPIAMRWRQMVVAAVTVAVLAAGCTDSDSAVTIDDESSTLQESESAAPIPEQAMPGEGAPFQSADDVAVLYDQWRRGDPGNYHYRAHMFTLSFGSDGQPAGGDECGANGGAVAAWIEDGVAVEGQMPESACVIDLASPTRLPLTGDEIFERTLALMTDGIPAQIYVNEFGFPETIFTESRSGVIEFALRSFSDGAEERRTASDEPARLGRAQARWANTGVSNYLVEVEVQCQCQPEFRGPFEVTVAGGQPAASIDGQPLPDGLTADQFAIDGLFSLIEQNSAADRLQVIYDNRGIPLRIDIDPDTGIADDEQTLTVTRFVADGADTSDLRGLLSDMGAAVDSAPGDALNLGDATLCGLDDVSLNGSPIGGDPIARACFTARWSRGVAAVLVQRAPTAEGDPIIDVLRANADGSLQLYSDTTRDAFGTGGWQTRSCSGLDNRSEIGPNFFTLRCG